MKYFDDDDHAIVSGMVASALLYLQAKIERNNNPEAGKFSVDIEVDEEANITNRIFIERENGVYVLTIEKEE